MSSLSVSEIQKHNSASDCWLVVDNNVWNLTDFAPNHPGGSAIIHRYAGLDASETYNSIHAPTILLDNLGEENLIGTLDATVDLQDLQLPSKTVESVKDLKQSKTETTEYEKPPLHTLISSYDFEEVASKTLSKKTWAFYSSAATDLITMNANKSMLDRIWWRPRILRDVREANTKTSILGCKVDLPLFVSPAAMARMVHPEGEKAMARGCASNGVAQCISTNASYPFSEITSVAPTNPFFFQLYVNKDRAASEKLLHQVEAAGAKAIFLTVDAPLPGKREADERVKADTNTTFSPVSGAAAKNDKKGGGLGRTMGAYIDAGLKWEDLKWLSSVTSLPIVLKGVQTVEDVRIAMEVGVAGVVLSNHGGRSLDTSPPAILTLLEVRKNCPEAFDKLEIFVDGGIRRGTDILKCLCLGAKAVGMGRHFLYALNYGQEGIDHFINIMRDELETTMKLVGITSLDQAHPGLLNTLDIDHLVPKEYGISDEQSWAPRARL